MKKIFFIVIHAFALTLVYSFAQPPSINAIDGVELNESDDVIIDSVDAYIIYSHTNNMLGNVTNVRHIYGATVLRQKSNWLMGNGAAVTIGNYITGGDKIAPDAHNSLFQHEYGHYLQSQAMGPLYLLTVGEPSLWNSKFGSRHDFQSYERDANYRAFKYFNENLKDFSSLDWDFLNNPLTRSRCDYIDYKNPDDIKRVEYSLQKFYLFF